MNSSMEKKQQRLPYDDMYILPPTEYRRMFESLAHFAGRRDDVFYCGAPAAAEERVWVRVNSVRHPLVAEDHQATSSLSVRGIET